MNTGNSAAILQFDENGNIASINIIANTDTETTMVQKKLLPITKPNRWARIKWTKLKRLLLGGLHEKQTCSKKKTISSRKR